MVEPSVLSAPPGNATAVLGSGRYQSLRAMRSPGSPRSRTKDMAKQLFERVALVTIVLATPCHAVAQTAAVGPPEVIYDVSARNTLQLPFWPDGIMGYIPTSVPGQYAFYGANGPTPFRTVGTLQQPAGVSVQRVTIKSANANVSYLSGGPVFADPLSGRLLMFYHAEYHRGSGMNFYAVIGLAIQDDSQGLSFTDLGLIVQPNLPSGSAPTAVEILGAPFIVKDGYFLVYFSDAQSTGVTNGLAVARAPVADVVQAALAGRVTNWYKYYTGTWSEPAMGGRSSPLEETNQYVGWLDVKWNAYLNRFVMVSTRSSSTSSKGNLFLSTSLDGIQWSALQQLDFGQGESFYPTIVGNGRDATTLGASFYVYYTSSALGVWERWRDAALTRRLISFPESSTWTASVNCLLNWMEQRYSEQFRPAGSATQSLPPYLYRYYPGTNTYLGVATDDTHLYSLGPASGGAITDAGAVSSWFQSSACY
jgi:hypothetical protein